MYGSRILSLSLPLFLHLSIYFSARTMYHYLFVQACECLCYVILSVVCQLRFQFIIWLSEYHSILNLMPFDMHMILTACNIYRPKICRHEVDLSFVLYHMIKYLTCMNISCEFCLPLWIIQVFYSRRLAQYWNSITRYINFLRNDHTCDIVYLHVVHVFVFITVYMRKGDGKQPILINITVATDTILACMLTSAWNELSASLKFTNAGFRVTVPLVVVFC